MKKFLLAVVIMTAATAARAWERPLNPDRFPSIGLSLEGWGVEGDQKFPSAPSVGDQDREDSYGFFIIDTRLPLTNSFTLDLALGSVGYNEEYDETPALDSAKFEGKGGYFRIGMRYYFNGGAGRTSL